MQHVLPRRFRKVRYYGWMRPGSPIDIDEIRWLVCLSLGVAMLLAARGANQRIASRSSQPRCQQCGGALRVVKLVKFDCRFLLERG